MANELMVLDPAKYPALSGDIGGMIRGNLAGEQVTAADLTRIKVPPQGSTLWMVPGDNGDQTVKEIEGVIVHIARRRAYWASPEPGVEPPQCHSVDCVSGIGDPGGACEKCPKNQFGSAPGKNDQPGRGKACKESKLLFLLRAGQMLPDVVSVPPASLKAVRQYQLKLKVPYWGVVTRLTLNKTKNAAGTAYSEIVVQKAAELSKETVASIAQYAQGLRGVFEAVRVDEEGGTED